MADIEFVAILLLFYVLIFRPPPAMWDFNTLTRYQTCTLPLEGEVLTTGLSGHRAFP